MKFEDLIQVELTPYSKDRYERIRTSLNARLQQAIVQGDSFIVAEYKAAIHLSYCAQNLHKNFVTKLIGLLQYYNKNGNSLPSEMFFEPSRPNVFPPPPKSDDDLPVLNKTLIHHANFYEMKSMPVTWKNLVEQYLECIEYAIHTDVLDDCVKKGSDGCFDNCISEMGIWKTMHATSTENDDSLNKSPKI